MKLILWRGQKQVNYIEIVSEPFSTMVSTVIKGIKYIIQITYLVFLFFISSLSQKEKSFNKITKKIDEEVVRDFKKCLAKSLMNF